MSSLPFTRNLGERPGVQLNPLRDNTDYPSVSLTDQVFATVGKFARGRIDKAFIVTQSNQARTLGAGGSIAANPLNECRVQIYEALANGATNGVVARLRPADAVMQLMIVKAETSVDAALSVAAAPAAGSLFSIKHLECFNDGVVVEVNAVEVLDAEEKAVASKLIRLRLLDPVSGELLFPEFAGSLDPLAKDEYRKSLYLPDIVSATTDLVEVSVLAGASVEPTCVFYGTDETGADKFASKLLDYFSEGVAGYVGADLDRACTQLRRSQSGYGFIGSGGTQDAALISKLIALGFQTNKQVRWDISGKLSVAQAVNFYKSVGGTDSLYSQCFYAPILADDPLNGGKAVIGTSGLNIGLACARNAQKDSNGVAAKNWPVAGSDFPLNRSGLSQILDFEDDDLKLLAKTKINPIRFVDYASGGRYVFDDSLTGALTNADRGLIAVADMATSVDDDVARYAQECLQKPMDVAIKRMTDFLQAYFEALETAGWIKPSAELGNRAFVAEIKRNAAQPNKAMDVGYWVKYDGTNRATYITQTLSK
ncbi:hypothetical protein [Stutzerimonas nitrititolerans]|uniref:hypothetical protein n=1 Tax=Stutzerimonas nitrititolerans TaxID=2482751 RepID=UPI0028A801EC|nr:hypothetical protein [Stutzerimonas nitrititolerans]